MIKAGLILKVRRWKSWAMKDGTVGLKSASSCIDVTNDTSGRWELMDVRSSFIFLYILSCLQKHPIQYPIPSSCQLHKNRETTPNGARLSSTLPDSYTLCLTFLAPATSTSKYKPQSLPTNNFPHSTYFIPYPRPQKDLTNTDPFPSLQAYTRRDSTSLQQ